jgi:hypothetical protein
MKKDLMIGVFSNLPFAAVAPWLRSVHACGFTGDKVIVAIGVDAGVTARLAAEGFTVISAPADPAGMRIHMQRFLHIFDFLKERHPLYRYVITTDVRDVVFQKNPADYLTRVLDGGPHKLLAVSEAIRIRDEAWNRNNIVTNFGEYFYQQVSDREVYNVGTLAGEAEYIKDLAGMIFQLSMARPDWVADQAAFNLLVNWQPYRDVTRFARLADGWACNLHVTHKPDQLEEFGPYLLEPRPTIISGEVRNQEGDLFHIVHQWDRVPELVEAVVERYLSPAELAEA